MSEANNRLLAIDDQPSIREDFQKIFAGGRVDAELARAESVLFATAEAPRTEYQLVVASQGEEGVERVREAMAAGQPFAVAFLDVRMPPGIDGIQTAHRLWQLDPDLQIVICSAYSDYSWLQMTQSLGASDRWVLLKKPFENIEALQLAAALARKRALLEAARAQSDHLGRVVTERTRDLSTALRRLEREAAEHKGAEEARHTLDRRLERTQRLESLAQFAAGVAHDFNNILTGIAGHAAIARSDVAGGSEAERHLREVEAAVRRAAGVCDQMLVYAGQSPVEGCELDVNQLVLASEELVRTLIPRDVDLAFELEPELPAVVGDQGRLRQVVLNLVLNGAEALRSQRRQLRVATARATLQADELERLVFAGEAGPGAFVCIEVKDTGVGMSEETRRRLFEPFFTTKLAGRGLGLAAALGIVRSHGGALDAISTPGEGSIFRVYLPVAQEEEPGAKDERLEGCRGDARILLADDEECVRIVAGTLLRQLGYEVTLASDGHEAVERLRAGQERFDAVVLDATMPSMGGAETLEAMRALRPGLPAVLVSGYGKERAMQGLLDRANTLALHKPYTIEELCTALARVIGQAEVPPAR